LIFKIFVRTTFRKISKMRSVPSLAVTALDEWTSMLLPSSGSAHIQSIAIVPVPLRESSPLPCNPVQLLVPIQGVGTPTRMAYLVVA
jgi:hypothetical protein